MKYLFYILVLVNLLFLGWKEGRNYSSSIRQDSSKGSVVAMDPLDSLSPEEAGFELLPDEPDPVSSEAPAPEGKGSVGCFVVGPYASAEEAEGQRVALAAVVREAEVSRHSADQIEGYWVIYPKATTAEGGLANRQMLNNRGIYETWLFDRGPLSGAISLGLYPTQEAADAAVLGFRDKGVVTRVKPRLVRGVTYWVKLPWEGTPLALDEALQLLRSQDESLKIPLPAPCP